MNVKKVVKKNKEEIRSKEEEIMQNDFEGHKLFWKWIVVTHNTVNGKPRGYAFIEYEHERDMHCE
ncbi:unnamed protein product [Timema podura]|uniref:RRM domain-containing protein n=1 Tax=Timema podura TaxID=61482 RepID=A0ABN7NMI9_TIMPD|nr:unnamed protein product [Timema podura]